MRIKSVATIEFQNITLGRSILLELLEKEGYILEEVNITKTEIYVNDKDED